MEKKKNKKLIISGIIIGVIILIGGLTYALWTINYNQQGENKVKGGCFDVEIIGGTAINDLLSMPKSDEEGMEGIPYEINIQNVCTIGSTYQINLEIMNGSDLPESNIKYGIDATVKGILSTEEEIEPTVIGADKSYKIETGTLSANTEVTKSIYVWLKSDAIYNDIKSQEIEFKFTVVAGAGEDAEDL